MMYFLGWALFLVFFKLYLGLRVVGRENVPEKGAFIMVSNHVSYFDPILLGTSVYRSLNFMARDNLFKKPCFAWTMRKVHAFPVKRHGGDLGALKKSFEVLASGKPLVIFPEGTRAKDRELKDAKPGVGFIITKANVPVVPAYVAGSFDALPRGLNTLRRHPVAVFIGEPIIFDKSYYGKRDKESYQKISDEIMLRIANLKDKYEPSPFYE